jgi:hypothetical protein
LAVLVVLAVEVLAVLGRAVAVAAVEVLVVKAPVVLVLAAVLPRTTLLVLAPVVEVALMVLGVVLMVPVSLEGLPGLAEFCRPFFRRV